MSAATDGRGPDDALPQRLDAHFDEQREVEAEAAGLEDAPGVDGVRDALEGLWAAEDGMPSGAARGVLASDGRPATRRSGGSLLAAAAALLLAAVWWWWPADPPGDGPVLLGDGSLTLEPAPDLASIRWQHPAPAGLRFQVELRDAARPDAALLARSLPLDGSSWAPPAVPGGWPAVVLVELLVLDAEGQLVDGASAIWRRDG